MASSTTTTMMVMMVLLLMMMMMMMVTSVRGDANPGIYEVDLVFPRNATYTPQALMPIVFAVQNPALSSPLLASIFWALLEGDNSTAPGSIVNGLLELGVNDPSTSDLLLVTRIVNTVAYPDGVWTLSWSVVVSNCSQPPVSGEDYNTTFSSSSTVFTTSSKSGQPADLVAATTPDTCGTIAGFAFNATSFKDECGVLQPETKANPCAAKINSSAASSIYAAATATACLPYATHNPNVICPTSTNKPSSASRTAALSTSKFLTLLLPAALTVLINLG